MGSASPMSVATESLHVDPLITGGMCLGGEETRVGGNETRGGCFKGLFTLFRNCRKFRFCFSRKHFKHKRSRRWRRRRHTRTHGCPTCVCSKARGGERRPPGPRAYLHLTWQRGLQVPVPLDGPIGSRGDYDCWSHDPAVGSDGVTERRWKCRSARATFSGQMLYTG